MTTKTPWHKRNKERHRENGRRWYKANKKKVQAKNRKWAKNNKERFREYAKAWRKRNPFGRKSQKLKREYGLTLEQFNAMLLKQGGWCAICHSNIKDQPNVDHCHNTGKVRGLLCKSCNFMLGLASDSPAILRAAAKYLTKKR